MTEHLSLAGQERLIRENHKLETRFEKEKSTAREFAEKSLCVVGAAATGAAYGYLNATQGGTSTTPYMVAGQVPLDLAVAGLGMVAILACPVSGKSKEMLPAAMGAGSAAIGIAASRYAAQYQAQAAAAAGTAPSASTPSVQGFLPQGMSSRQSRPGEYGPRSNIYVSAYAPAR